LMPPPSIANATLFRKGVMLMIVSIPFVLAHP
jgi:hypothetical protein